MENFVILEIVNKLPTDDDIRYIERYLEKHPNAKRVRGFKITRKCV